MSEHEIAVVGAGWAGLSAAVRSTEAGRRVLVIEAAQQAGGRAREARLDFGHGPLTLDAGQHLLVGAYRESLALAQQVQAGRMPFARYRLALHDTGGLCLQAARLPAPLHLVWGLLRSRGFARGERMALARLMGTLTRSDFSTIEQETVSALLTRLDQPPALVERLWAPLCVAALNTAPREACARSFAIVLRETLGARAGDSDFIMPADAGTLADALSRPAEQWLATHGAQLRFGSVLRALSQGDDGGWCLDLGDAHLRARQVVLAIPPYAAARLLAPLSARAAVLDQFVYDAITTVYLAWAPTEQVALPRWIMLRERPAAQQYGQWLFDRGRPSGQAVAAVVVSARGRAGADPQALAGGIARQVSEQLSLPLPAAWRSVTEKRATFRCTPQRPRLRTDCLQPELPGLWLAGDYLWPDYPATLEAAVRSGRAAAQLALQA